MCCSVSESLERLGLDYIDVILVHDVEYVDDLKEVGLAACLTPHAADKAFSETKWYCHGLCCNQPSSLVTMPICTRL